MPLTLASTQMVGLKFDKQVDYEGFLFKFEGSQEINVSDDQTVNVTIKTEGRRENDLRSEVSGLCLWLISLTYDRHHTLKYRLITNLAIDIT
jgi:hypothetical protein